MIQMQVLAVIWRHFVGVQWVCGGYGTWTGSNKALEPVANAPGSVMSGSPVTIGFDVAPS
jgi:hypothetical protein